MTDPYGFAGVPVEPVTPGTTLLVTGSAHAGTRELAYRLLAADHEPDGGTVVVTTNQRAERIAQDCAAAGVTLTRERAGVVSCVGGDEPDEGVPATVVRVSGPGDLTGIGMRFSGIVEQLHQRSVDRVRSGVVTVSTLLSFSDLRTVSRFVHTLVGRVGQIDGLGVLVMDPEAEGDRAVSNVAQFCDARVDVRDEGGQPELRVRGIPGQPREWTPFELYD
jgi:hypothetical protein